MYMNCIHMYILRPRYYNAYILLYHITYDIVHTDVQYRCSIDYYG